MKISLLLFALLLLTMISITHTEEAFKEDTIKTSKGDLKITFIGHGTLMFTYGEQIIHIDPWSSLADYTKLPKADLILITHEHRDHLDMDAIKLVRTEKTVMVYTETCAEQIKGGIVMKNGEVKTVASFPIEAVPAYNIVHKRNNGGTFHPEGIGNGYVITFGDKRVYIAGDTENTPEMKKLKEIDIAFLPMNVPYTMTPEMVANAVQAFKPKILYPYRYSDTDTSIIVNLLKDMKGIEVRIRDMN